MTVIVPLLDEAVSLRAGRQLLTYEIRIWPEAAGPDQLVAQATANWYIPRVWRLAPRR
jgi:hypothetical protein